MFSRLDDKNRSFGIDNYGVSITTLEEVFLRIGMEDKEERDERDNGEEYNELTMIGRDQMRIDTALAHKTMGHSYIQQLKALMIKRVMTYQRDFKSLSLTFLLPVVIVLVSAALIRKSDNIVSHYYSYYYNIILIFIVFFID